MLGDAGITTIYASEFKRTQETVAPLATRFRITPIILPARETEKLAQALNTGLPSPRLPSAKSMEIERLETNLRRSLGTKVTVTKGRKTGRIVIEYYSDEELTALTDRLLGVPDSTN